MTYEYKSYLSYENDLGMVQFIALCEASVDSQNFSVFPDFTHHCPYV